MRGREPVRIVVAGLGYVGLSLSVILAARGAVTALDPDENKVALVNGKTSPIADPLIDEYLSTQDLALVAQSSANGAFRDADFLVIATPTDYDPETNYFNTETVETLIEQALRENPALSIVIKSTVPVGFTDRMRQRHPEATIMFSPEFLREGQALWDNLHPSRIVVGDTGEKGRQFANLLVDGSLEPDVPVLLTDSSEAEAIKLFSNTYLASRVAFFNELDTYALARGLDTAQIISGVSLDPRIGDGYNNPSFGYGGYCLPKDTKQLLANYFQVPQNLIGAIVDSNRTRKDVLAADILQTNPKVVGIHRLVMKQGSDNFRQSAIRGIMRRLEEAGVSLIVYEPAWSGNDFDGHRVSLDLEDFKRSSDIIVTNRFAPELEDVRHKVYTRDIYGRD